MDLTDDYYSFVCRISNAHRLHQAKAIRFISANQSNVCACYYANKINQLSTPAPLKHHKYHGFVSRKKCVFFFGKHKVNNGVDYFLSAFPYLSSAAE